MPENTNHSDFLGRWASVATPHNEPETLTIHRVLDKLIINHSESHHYTGVLARLNTFQLIRNKQESGSLYLSPRHAVMYFNLGHSPEDTIIFLRPNKIKIPTLSLK